MRRGRHLTARTLFICPYRAKAFWYLRPRRFHRNGRDHTCLLLPVTAACLPWTPPRHACSRVISTVMGVTTPNHFIGLVLYTTIVSLPCARWK